MKAARRLTAGAVFLVTALLVAITGFLGQAPAAETAPAGLRVYTIVLDGLRPAEVNSILMPNLSELRAHGTWYEQARSVFIAETLPNHMAMMTGVLPEKNGIVANRWGDYRWGITDIYDMDNPSLIKADTLSTRLEDRCQISTATVLSKEYLYHLFHGEPYLKDDPADADNQRQADYHWDPRTSAGYIGWPDNHAIDQSTMDDGFLPWVRSAPADPQFAFVNLGDIDRSGHIDESGAFADPTLGVSAFRQGVIEHTDLLLGQFVDELKASGAWDRTVLIFTSDHGMDWSLPQNNFFVAGFLSEHGYLDKVGGSNSRPEPNGGAAIIYVKQPEYIAPIAKLLSTHEAVAFVATKQSIPELGNPTLAEMGLDNPNTGDIVVFLKPGWRVADENNILLPGNHGHPVTQHSVLLVTGGSPLLNDQPESVAGEAVFDPARRPFAPPAGGPGNLSIAPTVAALFGIGEPAGGYDVPPLRDAFEPYALAPHPACEAAVPRPDLSIVKSDQPDPAKVGQTLSYMLVVRNSGFADATGVTVVDELPAQVKPLAVSTSQGSASRAGQRVTANLGKIARGGSATVTILVRPQRKGKLLNQATVALNEADADSSNNADSEPTEIR